MPAPCHADASSLVDAITAVGAVGALVFAALAWFTSMNALRTTYRPVIRTVPMRFSTPDQALILKNVGFGPALSVMLFEARAPAGAEPLAEHALVERLGDSFGSEIDRPGRTVMHIERGTMEIGRHDRLLYQDVAGGWHETRFTFRQQDVLMRLLGPRRWYHALNRERRIPKVARTLAQAVRALEGL